MKRKMLLITSTVLFLALALPSLAAADCVSCTCSGDKWWNCLLSSGCSSQLSGCGFGCTCKWDPEDCSGGCDPGTWDYRNCGSGNCAGQQRRYCGAATCTWGPWGDCDTEGDWCKTDYRDSDNCGGFSSTNDCDESGSYTIYYSHCSSSGSCVEDATGTGTCYRDTDGDDCGSTDTSYSTCGGFSSSNPCDETGTLTKTVTKDVCSGGSCSGTSTTESEVSCTRNTDGDDCGSTYGRWSTCTYSSTCDEIGSQWRVVIEDTCSNGRCESDQYTETRECTRNTDDVVCGTTYGSWSTCSGCTGTQSRNIYDKLCSSGSCSIRGSLKDVEGRNCWLDDGTVCRTVRDEECNYWPPNCAETGSRGITISRCEDGSCEVNELTTETCTRNTENDDCGICGKCSDGSCYDTCVTYDVCRSYSICGASFYPGQACGYGVDGHSGYWDCSDRDPVEIDNECYWGASCCACFESGCSPCNGYGWCSYNYVAPNKPDAGECCTVNCERGGWDRPVDHSFCDDGLPETQDICYIDAEDDKCKCGWIRICVDDSDCPGTCQQCNIATGDCDQATVGSECGGGIVDRCENRFVGPEVTDGCEYRDYYCDEQGECIYIRSDYHENSFEWESCSADLCEHSGTSHIFNCEGSDCADHTIPIGNANCNKNTYCSASDGYECILGPCGTQDCPDDSCSANILTMYIDSCDKYCDGLGECADCTCVSSSYECSASSHVNCEEWNCGDPVRIPYYCTNDGTSWEWRTSYPLEKSVEACTDGIDNDCDGDTDDLDPDCSVEIASDSDGGNFPKRRGVCTNPDGSTYQDTCGSGNVLTEWYVSSDGNECWSTTRDCDSYDDYFCTASGSSLKRRFENWACGDYEPADECYEVSTTTTNTWTCDSSTECTPQNCEGRTYVCYYSNSGSYTWGTSYTGETACFDGYDNDCDGDTDGDDISCSAAASCLLNSASMTPDCLGGTSENCEVGESVGIKADWGDSCVFDESTYLKLKARSLDGSCEIEIIRQNPTVGAGTPEDCGQHYVIGDYDHVDEYIVNTDNSCTGIFNQDRQGMARRRVSSSDTRTWTLNTNPSSLRFGEDTGFTDYYYRSWVEWLVWMINDEAQVTDAVLMYDSPSDTPRGVQIIPWDGVYEGRYDSPMSKYNYYITVYDYSSSEAAQEVWQDMRSATPTYVDEANFPVYGNGQELDLGDDIISDIQSQITINGGGDIIIVLKNDDSGDFEPYTEISIDPQLKVTYIISGINEEWLVPTISDECMDCVVYAYEASLWYGDPYTGLQAAVIADVNPDDETLVSGSMTFSSEVVVEEEPEEPEEDPGDFPDPNTFEYTLRKKWNLISSPFDTITGVTLDECDATDGNFYFYNGETNRWDIKTVGIENMQKGFSYWFYVDDITQDTCKVRITGSGSVTSDELKIHVGWSQMASPKEELTEAYYLINKCKDCEGNPCTSMIIKAWDPIAQEFLPGSRDTLLPGKGYFVQCVYGTVD